MSSRFIDFSKELPFFRDTCYKNPPCSGCSKYNKSENVQNLTFEEQKAYLMSQVGDVNELAISCFLCNYGGKICDSDKKCKNMYACRLMKEAMDKLNNASTATEVEELLRPVNLYRISKGRFIEISKELQEKFDTIREDAQRVMAAMQYNRIFEETTKKVQEIEQERMVYVQPDGSYGAGKDKKDY